MAKVDKTKIPLLQNYKAKKGDKGFYLPKVCIHNKGSVFLLLNDDVDLTFDYSKAKNLVHREVGFLGCSIEQIENASETFRKAVSECLNLDSSLHIATFTPQQQKDLWQALKNNVCDSETNLHIVLSFNNNVCTVKSGNFSAHSVPPFYDADVYCEWDVDCTTKTAKNADYLISLESLSFYKNFFDATQNEKSVIDVFLDKTKGDVPFVLIRASFGFFIHTITTYTDLYYPIPF